MQSVELHWRWRLLQPVLQPAGTMLCKLSNRTSSVTRASPGRSASQSVPHCSATLLKSHSHPGENFRSVTQASSGRQHFKFA